MELVQSPGCITQPDDSSKMKLVQSWTLCRSAQLDIVHPKWNWCNGEGCITQPE